MFFEILGLPGYAYGHLFATILFIALTAVLLKRAGIRARHTVALGFLYLFAAYVYSKMLFDFVKAEGTHTVLDHPSICHFLDEGGFWGWQTLFFPAVLAWPFVFGLPRSDFLRAMSFVLPAVLAAQKVACFMAGCCWGRESSLPWAVVFPEQSQCGLAGVPLHPLQLYDAGLSLLILGGLVALDRTDGPFWKPFLFPIFVAAYALSRFATEFLKPEAAAGLLASQWIEGAACVALVLLVVRGRRRWVGLLGGAPVPG